MIKGSDERGQAAGIELASFLMRNCSSVLPIELLGNDEQTFAIVARHNELEQWKVLN